MEEGFGSLRAVRTVGCVSFANTEEEEIKWDVIRDRLDQQRDLGTGEGPRGFDKGGGRRGVGFEDPLGTDEARRGAPSGGPTSLEV
jgi:hypothetical protein